MGTEVLLAKIIDIAATAVLAGMKKDQIVNTVNDEIAAGASLEEVRDRLARMVDNKKDKVNAKMKELKKSS